MKKAIYKITNLLNGKIYIGQSIHPQKRWKEHCQKAKNKGDSFPIHLAIAKYGENNFSFNILEWTEDFDEEEKRFIKIFNSLTPNGYNVSKGGPTPILSGDNHPKSTISDKNVLLVIKELKQNKLTDREIAKKYNVSDKVIADINHGYSHKIDGEKYPIRIKKGKQKLTEQQANQIKLLLKTTSLSYQNIADLFHVTKGNIAQINAGRSFKREKDTYPIRSK